MTNIESLEHQRLLQVARQYRTKGYKVILGPSPSDLPAFLKKFHPDLMARSASDNVIVQVKSHESLGKAKQLAQLADVLDKRKGWRLELVVTNPKALRAPLESAQELPNEELRKQARNIEKLIRANQLEAAQVMGWSLCEAGLRMALTEYGVDLKRLSPMALAKTAFSYGVIARHQFEVLERSVRNRNKIVHGYKPERISKAGIRGLLDILDWIIHPDREWMADNIGHP